MRYLRDVLGMEWLPLRSLEIAQTNVEVQVPGAKMVHVVVSQPFTAMDQALLDRMMKAIQISEYTVSAEVCEGPGVGLVLCPEVAALRGFKSHGDTMTIGLRRTIFSHSLLELREGPAPLVQRRKKLTWDHLQMMQTWLNE